MPGIAATESPANNAMVKPFQTTSKAINYVGMYIETSSLYLFSIIYFF